MSGSGIGSLKSRLASAFTKAAEAKEKAAGKTPDGRAKTAATPARTPSGPAVLLSATLDGLAKPLPGPADGADDDALASPQRAPEYGDAFAERLGEVMEAMGRDLGRMLAAFGLEDDAVGEAVKGFTGRFGEDDRKAAFGRIDGPPGEARPLAPSGAGHHDATAVSVEVANVELALRQDGTPPGLNLDRSSLSMARVSESARPQGLTIRADGFGADELDGIMRALQGGMTGRPEGLEGAATLIPKGAPATDGSLSLSLDLKGLLPTALGGKGAEAAEAMGKAIRKEGFDVRI
ncbi:hypothetical protein J2847_001453 [Azospirillum agricola]|uniref:hypothetical protein n=1 Tax=Azospirillum agricola TaxID=1720247 RepID=UPI001AE3FDAC|nr:hypothetical protein [Azospirillum agricola]MBP2228171.1 hypothetical protein [Azospirillum agricola]